MNVFLKDSDQLLIFLQEKKHVCLAAFLVQAIPKRTQDGIIL